MKIEYSNVFVKNFKLSYSEIERFKNLMLGDQVIIGCDEVIEMVNTEEELLDCIIYLWQQHSSSFRKNLPIEVKNWFLTKFEPNNKTYYKGMHFRPGTDIRTLALDTIEFTSVTDDYEIALDFAHGFSNSSFKDNCFVCAIYEVDGSRVFTEVSSSRDIGEKESIIYKPSFRLLEIV